MLVFLQMFWPDPVFHCTVVPHHSGALRDTWRRLAICVCRLAVTRALTRWLAAVIVVMSKNVKNVMSHDERTRASLSASVMMSKLFWNMKCEDVKAKAVWITKLSFKWFPSCHRPTRYVEWKNSLCLIYSSLLKSSRPFSTLLRAWLLYLCNSQDSHPNLLWKSSLW